MVYRALIYGVTDIGLQIAGVCVNPGKHHCGIKPTINGHGVKNMKAYIRKWANSDCECVIVTLGNES